MRASVYSRVVSGSRRPQNHGGIREAGQGGDKYSRRGNKHCVPNFDTNTHAILHPAVALSIWRCALIHRRRSDQHIGDSGKQRSSTRVAQGACALASLVPSIARLIAVTCVVLKLKRRPADDRPTTFPPPVSATSVAARASRRPTAVLHDECWSSSPGRERFTRARLHRLSACAHLRRYLPATYRGRPSQLFRPPIPAITRPRPPRLHTSCIIDILQM